MKMIVLSTLFLGLVLVGKSCVEADPCESTIKGRIVSYGSESPVPEAQVVVITSAHGGFFNGDAWLVVDTIVTDESGSFEVATLESFNEWVVKVFLSGHDEVIEVYNNKPCRIVDQNIELVPHAKVIVTTVDVPELQYEELHIKTLPEIDSADSLESRAILGPNDGAQLWLKTNTQSLIRYWFLKDGNPSDTMDLLHFADPEEILEINIKM